MQIKINNHCIMLKLMGKYQILFNNIYAQPTMPCITYDQGLVNQ